MAVRELAHLVERKELAERTWREAKEVASRAVDTMQLAYRQLDLVNKDLAKAREAERLGQREAA